MKILSLLIILIFLRSIGNCNQDENVQLNVFEIDLEIEKKYLDYEYTKELEELISSFPVLPPPPPPSLTGFISNSVYNECNYDLGSKLAEEKIKSGKIILIFTDESLLNKNEINDIKVSLWKKHKLAVKHCAVRTVFEHDFYCGYNDKILNSFTEEEKLVIYKILKIDVMKPNETNAYQGLEDNPKIHGKLEIDSQS